MVTNSISRIARGRTLTVSLLALAGMVGGSRPAEAQVLQDGDILIGANVYDEFQNLHGRIYRLRGTTLDVLITNASSGFREPTDLIVDSQDRIIFTAGPCGNNNNNSSLFRGDPATGQVELLACFPYIANPNNIPPGLPEDATAIGSPNGLHNARSLQIVIDDDVSGGVPQVSFAEAYGLSLTVAQNGVYRAMAFNYRVDQDEFEDGVSLDLLGPTGYGANLAVNGPWTYYGVGDQVGRALPNLRINLNLHATVGGVPVSVQGTMNLSAVNELLFDADILDNTVTPNVTVQCGMITDNEVPSINGTFNVLGVSDMGFLNGELFVNSSQVSTGVPYMFNLARRAPFLHPNCTYLPCASHYGPYEFFDGSGVANAVGDGDRILGAQSPGKVLSVTTSGFTVLAEGLVEPRGAIGYPPPTPPITSGALVIRVDSPVNVMVTAPDGRRIGHAADGSPVNDFGDSGVLLAVGPEGHPLVYAVIDPEPGDHRVQVVSAGDGPYTLRGYLAETSTGGAVLAHSGEAPGGQAEHLRLRVQTPLTMQWLLPGDLDADGDVDLADYADFPTCMTGPDAGPVEAGCEAFDLELDGDVDLLNFAEVQSAFTGS